MFTISIILALLLIVAVYVIVNLIRKLEKYEDFTQAQTGHLQSIADLVRDSKEKLETTNIFKFTQGDDEAGIFFEQIKEIQKTLNEYVEGLEAYGKKEEQQ